MGNKCNFYVDVMCLNEEVTGSLHLCVVKFPNGESLKFIVDCGMFQEPSYAKYNDTFPFEPEKISFALITHAHLDHIGRLPLLVKNGFNGSIYSTPLTADFMKEALTNTAMILKQNCKRDFSKPLYTLFDVKHTIDKFVNFDYNKTFSPQENIDVIFFQNGHLLGAAMILIKIHYENEEPINLLFTGDYSKKSRFCIINDLSKEVLELPITIVQEATYGTTNSNEVEYVFKKNTSEAIANGKSIFIPAFSLQRTQEILLSLKEMQDEGILSKEIPIFSDGSLSIAYTHKFLRASSCFKENAKVFLPQNFSFITKEIRASHIADTSQKISISSSGMCSYGPAPEYLRNYLSYRNYLVHLVGYPAAQTLSRELKECNDGEIIKICGIPKKKLCQVEFTTEFSSHAKLDEIIDFLSKFTNLKLLLINHGENDCKDNLAKVALDKVAVKDIAIESRKSFYRIGAYGLVKPLATRFL